jgi:hypothetical protein
MHWRNGRRYVTRYIPRWEDNLIFSRVSGYVTNNNGFWIWRPDLLALLKNYVWLYQLTHWTPSERRLSLTNLGMVSTLSNSNLYYSNESESYVTTDGQSTSLSWNKAPFWGLRPGSSYCQTVAGLLTWGVLWRKDGSVVYNCCWPSSAQSFSGSSSVELVTIFYCLRFESSIFVVSYDSQGYGGGIRPHLHTGNLGLN